MSHSRGEGHGKTEEGAGAVPTETKRSQEPRTRERQRQILPQRLWGKQGPAQHPDFRLQGSRIEREDIFDALNHRVCGDLNILLTYLQLKHSGAEECTDRQTDRPVERTPSEEMNQATRGQLVTDKARISNHKCRQGLFGKQFRNLLAR